ncbi:MAG: tetratricopeptide repeat protein [Rhizobacter sp.]|nr:tetratricopeptide repeat protein [Rhizobacter sp.]
MSEVTRLHRAGQTSAALQRAEKFLTGKPDDTQMRFLRGVLLADSQRDAEAMAVFAKLALDHPELAESHNNLGALHAAAGDYDKARLALEQAIRANPDYATAHENLGDVYAMLASQSYARAGRLDRGNTRLAPKLALVRELFKTGTIPGTSRTNSSQ